MGKKSASHVSSSCSNCRSRVLTKNVPLPSFSMLPSSDMVTSPSCGPVPEPDSPRKRGTGPGCKPWPPHRQSRVRRPFAATDERYTSPDIGHGRHCQHSARSAGRAPYRFSHVLAQLLPRHLRRSVGAADSPVTPTPATVVTINSRRDRDSPTESEGMANSL